MNKKRENHCVLVFRSQPHLTSLIKLNRHYDALSHVPDFVIPCHHFQSTISPFSEYHTTLFEIPYHPLQITTPPSSKYHTTLFKVQHHPFQSTIPPSSNYHTTIFKVPHHSLSHIPDFVMPLRPYVGNESEVDFESTFLS